MLYLASSPLPSASANAVNVGCMTAAFQAHGYDVTLVAPTARLGGSFPARESTKPEGVDSDAVPLTRLWFPASRGGGLLYRTVLRTLLRLRRPDCVYGRLLSGCRVAAAQGIPTAFEAHMPVWEQDTVKHRMFAEMTSRDSLRGVVVISHALKGALLEAFPALHDRVIVAHDAASYRPCPVFPRPDRSKPAKVLYTGSLYPGKGMELLLRVAPRCPWARFSVLGGSDDDIRKWRRLMPQETGNVEFLGRCPHPEVARYAHDADILVAPYQSVVSAHGGRRNIAQWMSPLKIFEYMAANRPMVVSDLPVLKEVLTHDRNALLVDPDDVDGWAAALESLYRNPDRAERLAAVARADFEHFHTWDARAERIVRSLGWTWRGDPAAESGAG